MKDNPKQPAGSAPLRSPGPLESPILSFGLMLRSNDCVAKMHGRVEGTQKHW